MQQRTEKENQEDARPTRSAGERNLWPKAGCAVPSTLAAAKPPLALPQGKCAVNERDKSSPFTTQRNTTNN
jgi:hypothetical protein